MFGAFLVLPFLVHLFKDFLICILALTVGVCSGIFCEFAVVFQDSILCLSCANFLFMFVEGIPFYLYICRNSWYTFFHIR